MLGVVIERVTSRNSASPSSVSSINREVDPVFGIRMGVLHRPGRLCGLGEGNTAARWVNRRFLVGGFVEKVFDPLCFDRKTVRSS